MKEIGVAFAISSVAAIVLMPIHPGLSSAAFGALFPTVLAYLERAQNRRLRNAFEGPPASRDTEDHSEAETQTDVQPVPVVPTDATTRSGIDWRPVIANGPEAGGTSSPLRQVSSKRKSSPVTTRRA